MTGAEPPAPAAAEILDQLTTAVAILHRDGSIVALNAAAEQLFSASQRQVAGRKLQSILPGLEILDEVIRRISASGRAFGQELIFSVPQEDRFNVQAKCRLSPCDGDFVIVEVFDATHWRQLDREQALINQHGVSRRIIRQLAHEVRNPLGGLRGAAQLLDRELTSPELREFTRIIIGEADRLVALTDSLLGPLRKPVPESLNVHEITEHVALLIASESPQAIRIYRDYDPSLPPVVADRDQLIQAMLNIARNAAQAIDANGQIIFRTRALTGYVIGSQRHRLAVSLEVEDNGSGIPPDIEDSIFYPLVTGREDGTGLGLPLAQDLISRHNGLIEYESEPGRTVFMVRLPVAD